jgi:hypothetical protein
MYISSYPTHHPDKLVAAFEGSPSATLGQAIAHFNAQAYEWCKRLVSGEFPDVPTVIKERSQAVVDAHGTAKEFGGNYTIVQTPDGFDIWISDGPDKYSLID